MSEITPEYIAAITREELEAEGYQFMQEYSNWWLFLMPDHVAHDGGYHTLDDALQAAREHYAPGRMLRELQQRNAALEARLAEYKDIHEWVTNAPEIDVETLEIVYPDGSRIAIEDAPKHPIWERAKALEALVREAYEAIDTDTDREGYFIRHIPTMQKDWRERAAKLLEGTE